VDTLSDYARDVQEVVLLLRDEGHVLTSLDQHVLATWWERGYPLPAVLRALWDAGRKARARKHRPRGLPLRGLDKAVSKAGERAMRMLPSDRARVGERSDRAPAAAEVAPRANTDPAARALAAVRASIDAALPSAEPIRRAALIEARAGLPDGFGDDTMAAMLRVSRRYYDTLLAADPGGPARLAAARASVAGVARQADPLAVDESARELVRRDLRAADPALDILALWASG
jgi:hypothetical protein